MSTLFNALNKIPLSVVVTRDFFACNECISEEMSYKHHGIEGIQEREREREREREYYD